VWQETRDPESKTAVNVPQKKALERWERTLQAIRPIAKSLINTDGPRAPTAIHGPLGKKFHLLEKANAIIDCLEKQFTPHNLCEESHERLVKARVKDLLEAIGNDPPLKISSCDLQKSLNSLKLRKACGIDGIPNGCLRYLPRRPLVHLTDFINHCIRLSHFLTSWKEAKVISLPKDPKFLPNLRPISLL
jgi:hypothetical protein